MTISSSEINRLQPESIGVSRAAVARLRQLLAEQDNPGLKLRVYVEGGGCSGFQYGFSVEAAAASDDIIIEQDGVQLLVDPASHPFLLGAEIDYEVALESSQFVVRNPNAQATCGCGSSFTA